MSPRDRSRSERGQTARVEEHSGPLVGLRVVDAGNMIAGPMAAAFLADLGADVIKLEHPTDHDPLRDWSPKRQGISLWWKVLNRNKRLVTLSLSKPGGRALFLELVGWADVVIENFRAGTFERWGLGYDVLSSRNPSVVLARVSGFGQSGPYARRPGYGTIAEAMSGIPSFTGHPSGPPTLPGYPMADTNAGLFMALGVMAAVYERERNPEQRGQVIDLGLYEALFRLVDSQVIGFDQLGLVKQRLGNRSAEDAPRNAYATADGRWVAISASSNRTFARLAEAIGMPGLADDQRFGSSSKRVENVEALDEILGGWFAERTCDAALEVLEAKDVIAGPLMDVADIFRDPQFQARGNIVEVADPDFGVVRMQGVVPQFSRTPGAIRFPGLSPGAHNDEVFMGLLGVEREELDRLGEQGAV